MNYFKIFFSIVLFAFLLLSGCGKKDTTIVQPDYSNNQPLKDLSGSQAPLSQVALINGDMEDSTTGYWNGGSFSNNSYSLNYSNSQSVSPSHSLNIEASGTSNSFAYWAQTFNASSLAGKKVTVSVSAKYTNVEGQGVILALRGDNTDTPEGSAEAFATTQGKVLFDGTSDWKTIEVSLDPVPAGIKSLTVYMMISASSGSVYFDNLSASFSEPSAPITDLTNGNMESGSYSPDYWWFGSGDNSLFTFAWDSNEYLSADHSLKISSQGSGGQFAFWAQTITASELTGKKITLNVNIKAANLTGKGVYIAIRGDDTSVPEGMAEEFTTTQGNVPITGSFGWKEFSITMDNVQPGIKSLTFYLIYGTETSGTVYFDDVSLTKE